MTQSHTEVLASQVAGKQAALVSGTNIKTINGSSVLGSGDLTVSAGPPADGSITNAKLADMAQATFKMRAASAGTGAPIDGTAAQAKTALAIATGDVSGLGTIATQAANNVSISGGSVTGITDLAVADGGTGASTAAGALTNLGAEPVTCIARGAGAAVSVASTSVVNFASCTNTISAGDTFSFYVTGAVLNNSGGTRTYTARVTIGATTFDLAVAPTYATSASNVGYINVMAEVAVISSSSIAATLCVRAGASAAVATVQNDVLAQDRTVYRTSGNNEIGSKTVAIGMLADANTATQTFTITRAEIVKGGTI